MPSPTHGFLPVVAAAIERADGRLLLQQCPPGKRHAGLWEFPGGKVEPEETPDNALIREIEEELGIVLSQGTLQPAGFASETTGPHGRPGVLLLLYRCREWQGIPEAREGQAFDWFSIAEARKLAMPPLDRELLDRLFPTKRDRDCQARFAPL